MNEDKIKVEIIYSLPIEHGREKRLFSVVLPYHREWLNYSKEVKEQDVKNHLKARGVETPINIISIKEEYHGN